MKIRHLVYFALISLAFASCQKNTASNIPQISLIYFGTSTSTDTFNVITDTPFIIFSLADGDADLGNNQSKNQRDIYIKYLYVRDSSAIYDTFFGYFFPAIDQSIENAKNGLSGTCAFYYYPSNPPIEFRPRPDSIHHKYGDTASLALYIVDRAGHHSNTIYTKPIIMRP